MTTFDTWHIYAYRNAGVPPSTVLKWLYGPPHASNGGIGRSHSSVPCSKDFGIDLSHCHRYASTTSHPELNLQGLYSSFCVSDVSVMASALAMVYEEALHPLLKAIDSEPQKGEPMQGCRALMLRVTEV